jgi:hypothetical protein
MTGTIELGCLAGVGDGIIDYQIHGIDRYIDRLDKPIIVIDSYN